MTFRTYLIVSTAMTVIASPAFAQQEDAANTDEVIFVTGVARATNQLETSNSVSAVKGEEMMKLAPRSAAEILRNIPGIRSESSGGEGNANIAVRGLPVASGGAKFLQLQEDGLPVLEFGDITFGNADIFLRADTNIARVESIRGGSASTFTSNSPGGIVNFISKTGKDQDGGTVQATLGLDYEEYRVDFDYGGALGNDMYFHVGGFYREGEGPREVGYNGNQGGQIKVNFTKEFDNGYIRFYGKYLNDRSVGYLPNPVRVTGTDADPEYSNVAGFDINEQSLHSAFFATATSLNGNNVAEAYDVRDGMRPLVKSAGLEAQFDLTDEWTVTERFRFSDISGGFTSPFPGSVADAQSAADSLGGTGSQLLYATGPNAGQDIGDPSGLNGNGLVANIVLFNVRLNSLDNITNDIRLNRSFDAGKGTADVTFGFYSSRQKIETEWLWTSHLLEVQGGGQAALLDVQNADGDLVTQNGTAGFSASFFGGCCRRVYDVTYSTNAPFAAVSFEFDNLRFDGSLRYDIGSASGQTFGADLGGGRVGTTSFDFDSDGSFDAAEMQTSTLPLSQPALVDYNYNYLSYSFGGNYLINSDLSVFARYSRGGRANADRILFNDNAVSITDGSLRNDEVAIDFVNQAELGLKFSNGNLDFFATGFWARTEEQNFEATTQSLFDRKYRALGLELEGAYRMGDFVVSGGGTFTDAEISEDNISPANEGNRPRRQAKFIYQATAQYDVDLFNVGVNASGTTSSFAQDNNGLVLPGFTQVNVFASVRPLENLELSINANNLFNVNGFTEAEEGSIPGNGIVRARSINGRTISAAVRYSF